MQTSDILELILDYGEACERVAKASKQEKADAISERYEALESIKRALRSLRTGDR